MADIASLNGQSRHISNTPGQRSDLAFNGKVDRYAPVTIRGGTNLLVPNPALDISVAFNNLELTTFSPYSGTYAGYAIDKGQLSMKLHYKLEGKRLEGDNDITIKKLQLGEKIKSDQAQDLPLGLAIALLSDANGVIQMNLKVKGDLAQPDFSLGNIIWDVLGNTLSKAITSPFSLLASLADGTEDLDELPFLPGDPALTPTQQDKLVKLAQALKDRPKLSMNIRGKVNFNEERPILQRQKLERVLAKLTGNPADLDLLEQESRPARGAGPGLRRNALAKHSMIWPTASIWMKRVQRCAPRPCSCCKSSSSSLPNPCAISPCAGRKIPRSFWSTARGSPRSGCSCSTARSKNRTRKPKWC